MPANVNRWRGQIGLPPVPEKEASALAVPLEAGGKTLLVDLNGTDPRTGKPSRMLVAVLPESGRTWFVKLTGGDGAVGREKEVFTRFVRSVQLP